MLLRPRFRPSKLLLEGDSVCSQCLRKLRQPPASLRRAISTSRSTRDAAAHPNHNGLKRGYFLGNGSIEEVLRNSRGYVWTTAAWSKASSATATTTSTPDTSSKTPQPSAPPPAESQGELPHRRRKRLKELEKQKQAAGGENGQFMPPDASSRLSTLSQALPKQSLKARAMAFLSLSKPRLSFLIILTTTTAYSLYPVPAVLSPTATTAPSLSTLTLTFLTIGTGLACASANTFNMLYESKWDAIMSRTRNRPLVRGLLSKRAAAIFGIATGIAGVTALYFGVNPTTAALGAANIFIYAGVYTPMKRLSAANTWAGAIVGGIPPLMGSTAAAGQVSTTTQPGDAQWKELLFSEESIGGWLLAALLFAWQFPHFNALSWPVREEYKAAGHRMMVWTNPARNARVALRYAILMFPICWGLSATGMVEPAYVPASAVVNGWMAYEAVKFWKHQGYHGSARGLFWASVWHLPVVMVLAMGMKKGLWQRVKTGIFGIGEEDEEWDD